MFTINTRFAVFTLVLTLLAPIATVHAEQSAGSESTTNSSSKREYLKIGGVANVRFVDDDHAIAVANGTFSALTAVVTNRTPNRDGSMLVDMTHTFLTAEGGLIVTEDKILLIPVPGRNNVFSISVDYTIVSAAGGLEGYEGQHFVSQGFIDGANSIASVRYDGEISRIRKNANQK